jgi:glyoxylase-like metal-dependent hydrolase (beta-lactamase superfamily II)
MQTPKSTRRDFCVSTGLAAAAACLAPRSLFAQEGGTSGIVEMIRKEAATSPITVQFLRGNISVLMGSGGNIAVLPGRDGKLLIDAGITESRRGIQEALHHISPDPIRHLINSHWHFDHTDGNAWLHSAGATILSHENTRKHLSTSVRVEGWSFTFPPAPTEALPSDLFQTERTVHLNGASIALKHYAPAHTDSDISIHFTDADVLHVADTWWNGYYPFIDRWTGGSIDGMINATEANLARATKKTILIPGHGPVGDRSDLMEYREMLVRIREKIAALKKQNKSLTEVVAAKPTAAYDARWGGFATKPDAFTALIYADV